MKQGISPSPGGMKHHFLNTVSYLRGGNAPFHTPEFMVASPLFRGAGRTPA